MASTIDGLKIEYWDYHRQGEVSRLLTSTREGLSRLRGDNPNPRISVVIPAFNEEFSLPGTLACLSANKFSGAEIVVVDNCSDDSTQELSLESGARVVDCERKGVGAARQQGLLAARGEVVVTTDADTFVQETWLNTINTYLESHPNVGAVYGRVLHTDEKGPNLSLEIYRFLAQFVHGVKNLSKAQAVVPGANFAARKDLMLRFGGYDSTLKRGEDIDLARKFSTRNLLAKLDQPEMDVITSARRMLVNGLFLHGTKAFLRNLEDFHGNAFRSTSYEDVRLRSIRP